MENVAGPAEEKIAENNKCETNDNPFGANTKDNPFLTSFKNLSFTETNDNPFGASKTDNPFQKTSNFFSPIEQNDNPFETTSKETKNSKENEEQQNKNPFEVTTPKDNPFSDSTKTSNLFSTLENDNPFENITKTSKETENSSKDQQNELKTQFENLFGEQKNKNDEEIKFTPNLLSSKVNSKANLKKRQLRKAKQQEEKNEPTFLALDALQETPMQLACTTGDFESVKKLFQDKSNFNFYCGVSLNN